MGYTIHHIPYSAYGHGHGHGHGHGKRKRTWTGTLAQIMRRFFPFSLGSLARFYLPVSHEQAISEGGWMVKIRKKMKKMEYAPCLAGGRAHNQPTTTQLYHHFSDVKRKQRRPERTSRARILRWVSFLGGVFGGQQNGKYFKLRHTEDWSGWAARAEVEKQPPNGSGYVIG